MKSISRELWIEIEKIFPCKKTRVGRPEFDRYKAFLGILYILKNGSLWSELPEKYGRPSTVHGKFIKWSRTGIFQEIFKIARKHYHRTYKHSKWYALDTLLKKAPLAKFSGKNPTDRSKKGIKQVILVDQNGAPLYIDIAPANIHDSQLFKNVARNLNTSRSPKIIAADSAFDAQSLYDFCLQKNIVLDAATNIRRSKNVIKHKPKHRWIVERTFGWFSWLRSLKICWSKLPESHLAFLKLACSIQLFKMSLIFG